MSTGYSGQRLSLEELEPRTLLSTAVLDPFFGKAGRAILDPQKNGNSSFNAAAVQSDGKIVAVGQASEFTANPDSLVIRFNSDGSLDPTFGAGGKFSIDLGGTDQANGVVIQPDGKIVVAGSGGNPATFVVMRIDATGQLDPSFADGGIARTGFEKPSQANAIALQPDEGIVVAGGGIDSNGVNLTGTQFLLARYTTDGQLDPSFGSGGRVMTPGRPSLPYDQYYYSARSLLVQAGGMILVGGTEELLVPLGGFSYYTGALARYNPDGSLDQRFHGDGVLTGTIEARALAVQADSKIIVAGGTGSLSGHGGGIHRGRGAIRPGRAPG